MTNNENNKRIAKNTVMLYIRMFLTMGVTLYTSRVVLNTLGIEDFGVYNVVGGIVTMFSFLSGAMSSATQRFLAVEIGRNDNVQLKKVFSISLSIYFLLSFVVVLLAETIGLWFLNSHMNIPAGRMVAAHWVYQFSVLAFTISVIQVPYSASIIAHEKMDFFAYFSIIEVILRLFIVYMLVWLGLDKLKLYAILTCSVSALIVTIYICYCRKKFEECHYHFYKEKSLFYSIFNFSGWSLYGNLAWVMMGQGLNILLNIFFGPVVNAARGIAFQVNAAITAFVYNFRTAVNPQVIKSYSIGNGLYMNKLVFESSKYSYYLLLLLSLPIFLETNTILHLWLKIVPEHSVMFCQLILVNTMIQCCDIGIIFSAIGRIKENQFYGGLIYLMILPISYVFLKYGYPPETVFYVQISATFIVNFGINLYLLKKIASINLSVYFSKLILPIMKVSIIASIFPFLLRYFMLDGPERFILVIVLSFLSVILSVYYFGMDKNSKIFVKQIIVSRLKRHRIL